MRCSHILEAYSGLRKCPRTGPRYSIAFRETRRVALPRGIVLLGPLAVGVRLQGSKILTPADTVLKFAGFVTHPASLDCNTSRRLTPRRDFYFTEPTKSGQGVGVR